MTSDEMIIQLEMLTRFSYEYLKGLSRKELEKLYRERVEKS